MPSFIKNQVAPNAPAQSFAGNPSIELLLHHAMSAAQAAGELLASSQHGPLQVDAIEAHDIKLALDRQCQELITRRLTEAFPHISVFGEEGGAHYRATEWQWIIDPIDGTVNFYHGFPHYCVLIALQHQGRTVLGVTHDPVRGETFTATLGGGAFLNGRPIKVSNRVLSEAIVSTGFAKSKEIVNQSLAHIQYLGLNARKLRMNGSAGLDLAYVAAGRLDMYLERTIRLWDIAAGAILLEEAGGSVELRPLQRPELAFRMIAHNGRLGLPGYFED